MKIKTQPFYLFYVLEKKQSHMKKIYFLICLLIIGYQSFTQVTLKIQWNNPEYLFYQTTNIEELNFSIENMSDELKMQLLNLNKSIEALKKVSLDKNDDGCHINGIFVFKQNPDVKVFREIVKHLNLNEFYVNDKKVLTKTLITDEEAHNKAMGFVYKDQVFNTINNDTSRIEYYDFQIYYAQTKLVYMYGKNYPKYLYEGYVAKYTELLEKQEKARDEFLKRTKKQ